MKRIISYSLTILLLSCSVTGMDIIFALGNTPDVNEMERLKPKITGINDLKQAQNTENTLTLNVNRDQPDIVLLNNAPILVLNVISFDFESYLFIKIDEGHYAIFHPKDEAQIPLLFANKGFKDSESLKTYPIFNGEKIWNFKDDSDLAKLLYEIALYNGTREFLSPIEVSAADIDYKTYYPDKGSSPTFYLKKMKQGLISAGKQGYGTVKDFVSGGVAHRQLGNRDTRKIRRKTK
jgi:hypothetical protein